MKRIAGFIFLWLVTIGLVACGEPEIIQNSDALEINSDYDLISMCTVKEGYEASIKEDNIDISKIGTYDVVFSITKNNKTKEKAFKFTVSDSIAPTVEASDAKVKLNASDYDLSEFIIVSDNSKETIVPEFDYSKLDVSKAGTYNVPYTVKDSSGNENKGELSVEVQAYRTTYTLAEMNKKIQELIDEKYSEVFSYDVDKYDDKMSINFKNEYMGTTDMTADYFVGYYPYIMTSNIGGKGALLIGTEFFYVSSNFLDYYIKSKVPVIILAEDGSKITFNMPVLKTWQEQRLYSTLMYFVFNRDGDKCSDKDIDEIYNLFKKANLTFRINSPNNNSVYPQGSLDEAYVNSLITMIDFYRDVEEELDWKPSANYE